MLKNPEDSLDIAGFIHYLKPSNRRELLKKLEGMIDQAEDESIEQGLYIRLYEIVQGLDDNIFAEFMDFLGKHVFNTDEFLIKYPIFDKRIDDREQGEGIAL
jgi:hypothetical protein